jgi:hypothetical protein
MLKSFSPGSQKQKNETFWSSYVSGDDSHARTPELEGPYQPNTIKILAELHFRTFNRKQSTVAWKMLDQQTLAPLAGTGLRWQPYWSKSFGNLSRHLGKGLRFTRRSRTLGSPGGILRRKTASWHNDSVALAKSCQILLLIKCPFCLLCRFSPWFHWYRLFHVLNLDPLYADRRSEPERSRASARVPMCSKFITYLFGQDMVSQCNLTSNLIRDITILALLRTLEVGA